MRDGRPVMPPMNLAETPEGYEIAVELPGMEPQGVEIRLSGGASTMGGQMSDQAERHDGGRLPGERRFDSFQRSLDPPEDMEAERIEATDEDRILWVTLPKSEAARGRETRIEVKPARTWRSDGLPQGSNAVSRPRRGLRVWWSRTRV